MLPITDDPIGLALVKVVGKFRCQISRSLKHLDLTSEQWGVLASLWERGGLSQKELADKVAKDQANMTRILDKLVKKGWVQRLDAVDDRRAYLLYLTDEGRQLVQIAAPLVAEVKKKLVGQIPEPELQAVLAVLEKMAHNLD
jgi:DNA-binding MarR family transcriptional regulator